MRHGPAIVRPGSVAHPLGSLCPYPDALRLMDELVARPASDPDLLLCLQHPVTITVGRRGGQGAIHRRELAGSPVPVYEVGRGGSVTCHAPGQLVIYPVVQLRRLAPPLGGGPLGDLGAYARVLEAAMAATCAHFGLPTCVRPGFSGLWLDDDTKIGSLGVGIRRGWTCHGLALNVCPDLEVFSLITPCNLAGVRMTSLHRELARAQRPLPAIEEVAEELTGRLQRQLQRAQLEATAP